MNALDKVISYFSPSAGLRRAHARKLMRSYAGAESNRLTNHKKPKNQSADQELLGPFGADALRAWARSLVRDNAYAWNVVDTIVSNVVGDGIRAQSTYETPEGEDIEDVNDARDKAWSEWCEVADVNGQLTFNEIQVLCQREIVEAGEVLVRLVNTNGKESQGIHRPVPLAIELIEADRLAVDYDTYRAGRENGNAIVRGVELNELGKPVAYWIYPQHPNSPYHIGNQTPKRIPASEILHLFRKDRIGQSRGVSWFAPIASTVRDLGVYIDNELQGSAIASCFTVAIKTASPPGDLQHPEGDDTTDANGNALSYIEPGIVTKLQPGEDVSVINPSRPNSNAEPWINLMLRAVSAGTGTNYEAISKDFSNTSYSSSRTSKLEDRPRYKRWQNYMVAHLCQPVWDRFCEAASRAGLDNFPTASELLDDRRRYAPVEWQLPEQPWVDPQSETQSAIDSMNNFMSTLQDEVGAKGGSWRAKLYQKAKEERLRLRLKLYTAEERTAMMMAKQTEANAPQQAGTDQTNVAATALNGAQVTSLVDVITQVGTGAMPKETAKPVLQAAFPTFSIELIDSIIDPIEPGSVLADGTPQAAGETAEQTGGVYMGLSTQQWNRNEKAVKKMVAQLKSGEISEAMAREFLKAVGMPPESIDVFIADAADGVVETPPPAEEVPANG